MDGLAALVIGLTVEEMEKNNPDIKDTLSEMYDNGELSNQFKVSAEASQKRFFKFGDQQCGRFLLSSTVIGLYVISVNSCDSPLEVTTQIQLDELEIRKKNFFSKFGMEPKIYLTADVEY